VRPEPDAANGAGRPVPPLGAWGSSRERVRGGPADSSNLRSKRGEERSGSCSLQGEPETVRPRLARRVSQAGWRSRRSVR
jgi:hypothetical protein